VATLPYQFLFPLRAKLRPGSLCVLEDRIECSACAFPLALSPASYKYTAHSTPARATACTPAPRHSKLVASRHAHHDDPVRQHAEAQEARRRGSRQVLRRPPADQHPPRQESATRASARGARRRAAGGTRRAADSDARADTRDAGRGARASPARAAQPAVVRAVVVSAADEDGYLEVVYEGASLPGEDPFATVRVARDQVIADAPPPPAVTAASGGGAGREASSPPGAETKDLKMLATAARGGHLASIIAAAIHVYIYVKVVAACISK
jgi:hypothetical protein